LKNRYFCINKPFNVVSQFVSPDNVGLLGDIDFDFPEGTHAIGRLDSHSEGLLILTTNKRVTQLLFQGEVPHKRTYLVQVKDHVSPESLSRLQNGVTFKVKGGEDYTTALSDVSIVDKPADLFEGIFGKTENWPHTFLKITLTEGKFHQVRKMVAAINHRCQRLIRISIEDMELGNMQPGEVRELEETEFFRLLKIENWR
jgi:23S rRNA pseudouridine2457 synthase